MTKIEDNAVVLFQGDSVTDTGRDREDDRHLGRGYAMMAAAMFSALYPEKRVTFLNRGISGNRVRDLQTRWQQDCLDLKPTWVSILIGINDCWRRFDQNDATTVQAFEKSYREILDRTKESLDAHVVLCEPFVLPVPADRKLWRKDLDPKIHIVRELATEYEAHFIPLDGLFAQAATRRRASFWAPDGVHPSLPGHALIARAWLSAVNVKQ